MVDWSNAPEGAVDVRKGADGRELFTNGADKYYEYDARTWWCMSFDYHNWPVVEKRPSAAVSTVAADMRQQLPRNKYDREIIGKYGTGKCTVDVYRVLSAFGPLPPETQHAIKKLLAPGKRGVKDERQDLLEAIQSIEARLQYLEACE